VPTGLSQDPIRLASGYEIERFVGVRSEE